MVNKKWIWLLPGVLAAILASTAIREYARPRPQLSDYEKARGIVVTGRVNRYDEAIAYLKSAVSDDNPSDDAKAYKLWAVIAALQKTSELDRRNIKDETAPWRAMLEIYKIAVESNPNDYNIRTEMDQIGGLIKSIETDMQMQRSRSPKSDLEQYLKIL